MHLPVLLIPMSGLAKRFSEYGIDIDKQILKFDDGITPFEKSMDSLSNKDEFFIAFTVRSDTQKTWLKKILLDKYENQFEYEISVTGETESPIHSLNLVLKSLLTSNKVDRQSAVSIFTMDVEFGIKTDIPTSGNSTIIFKAKDGPYSFVALDSTDRVIECAEKKSIGGWANAGLYSVETIDALATTIDEVIAQDKKSGELSIAEALLSSNKALGFIGKKIESIYIFGTPEEWIFYNNEILPFLLGQNQKRAVLLADHSGKVFINQFSDALVSAGWKVVIIDNSEDYSWESVIKANENQITDEYFDKNAFLFVSCQSGQGMSNALSTVLSAFVPVVATSSQLRLALAHTMARAISFSAEELIKNNNIKKCVDMLGVAFEGGRHQRRLLNMKTFDVTPKTIIDSLENYKDGWTIGDFLPRLARLPFLEFGIKTIKDNMIEPDLHYHNSGVEISLILQGGGTSGNSSIKKDDILIQYPYTQDRNIFVKNTKLAVIRFTDRKPKKLYHYD